jgi:putative PIN family toxin of toxin-antitoxin system
VYDHIAICDGIVEEVRRILVDKFDWTESRLAKVIDRLLLNTLEVEVTGSVRGACRDPNDDMILECAVNSGASMIMSNDRDLLDLDSYRAIRIMKVRQYLNEFAQ